MNSPMVKSGQQRPAVRTPVCPNCRMPMRYETTEADRHHDNLRHVLFVCSCGLASDQMVADIGRTS